MLVSPGKMMGSGSAGVNFFTDASAYWPFASSKSLVGSPGPTLDFTRASGGTYYGSDGLLKTAAINEARFDHDPATLASLGLLIEESRTNLCLQSEDFTNAAWVNSFATITANSTVAPDGNQTADTLTDNNATQFAKVSQTITVPNDSLWRTATIYVLKDNDETRFPEFQLYHTGGTGTGTINLQLNTKTGATVERASSGNRASSVVDAGLWWHVILSVQNNTSGATALKFDPHPAVTTTWGTTEATATGSIVMWGTQVEAAAFLTSYIPTTTAQVVRAADVCDTTDVSWYNKLANTAYAEIYYRYRDAINNKSFGTVHAGGNVPRQGFTPSTFHHSVTSHDGTNGTFTGDIGGRVEFTDDQTARMASRWGNANEQGFKDNLGSPYIETTGVLTDLTSFTPTTFDIGGSASASLKCDQIWIKAYASWNTDKGEDFINELIP